ACHGRRGLVGPRGRLPGRRPPAAAPAGPRAPLLLLGVDAMGIIVGLDVGRRRIGVAASDELGLTAQPVKVLTRVAREKDLDAVAQLCRELKAEQVVVGMPYRLDGTMGPQAEMVAAFVRRLQERL